MALCRAVLLDMVLLPVACVPVRVLLGSVLEPDTMMMPLIYVADRSVVETDPVLLLMEPDTMMLPPACVADWSVVYTDMLLLAVVVTAITVVSGRYYTRRV